MPRIEDQEPPFVPQSPANTEDATPQGREVEQISTDHISSSSGVREQGGGYGLRSRGVDEATRLRREENKRMRLERIKKKLLRRERENKEAQEQVDRILKRRALLHEESEAWKNEQRKEQGGDSDSEFSGGDKGESEKVFRHEIVNGPPESSEDWVPYESDDEFGTEFELKRTNWEVEKFALDLAQCTVGLYSFTGVKKEALFSCSGTIFEFKDGTGYVVTSASLIRCPDKDERADNLTIDVSLTSDKVLKGFVSDVDFYYNVCVIKFPCEFCLPRKSFSPNTGFFNFYEHHSKDVIALGRCCEPWSLKVALGKLIPRRSRFDCEELLVSSCKISKRGVGGPLMDFDGNLVGMNFYDKKGTPFLPSFIVSKCLQHFKDFKKVIRPLYGLRVETLYEANLSVLEEKIQHGLPERCGVIVKKIEEPSAELSDIKVGDIITHVDGVPFSNAAELGGILLDMCGKLRLDWQKLNLSDDCDQTAQVMSLKFRLRTYRGCKSEVTTRTINIAKFTPSGHNRWPLPRPIIIRLYHYGKLVDEQRYTTDY